MNIIEKDLFKPVSPKRTFVDISDQIKELIYSGELKPKDRLPSERELATRFNVGRMAVREALRILEEAGFIYVKQGADGGIFVRELDSTGMTKSLTDLIKIGHITIEEITEARINIESIIIESIIKNITESDLAELEANIRDTEKLIENAVSKKIPVEIVNFHVLLAGFSKNQLYKYFHKSLVDLSYLYIREFAPELTLSPNHLEQHKAIFKAVKEKNLKDAKKALEKHLVSVNENITRAIHSN